MQLQIIEILILIILLVLIISFICRRYFNNITFNIDYDTACKRKIFTKDLALLDNSEKKTASLFCETVFYLKDSK